jgi:hypothetical protein
MPGAIGHDRRISERKGVKPASQCAHILLFALLAGGIAACARPPQSQGNVTVFLQWPSAAAGDTLLLEARTVRLHESLTHEVPAGAMALEGYMLGSSEQATMLGWVDAREGLRLPVFNKINAVPDLLAALRDLPSLPRSRAVPSEDSQHLLLFFLQDVGDAPRHEVVARFWAQGGSRLLRIDPRRSMVRASPLVRLRDRDLPDTSTVKNLWIRVQGPPELRTAVPFLVVRDGDRWTASTLSWNRVERVTFSAHELPTAAPGRLMLYLFAPTVNGR